MTFSIKNNFLKLLFIYNFLFFNASFAYNHNIYETIGDIKNKHKNSERADYTGSNEIEENKTGSNIETNYNSADKFTSNEIKITIRI